MKVQAEVSLYPLRTRDLAKSIWMFTESLAQDGIEVDTGPMSSHLSGKCEDILGSLARAFEKAARNHQVVMTVKVLSMSPEALKKRVNGIL